MNSVNSSDAAAQGQRPEVQGGERVCLNCSQKQAVEFKDGICPICGFVNKEWPPVWKTMLRYAGAVLITLIGAWLLAVLLLRI